MPFTPGTSGNPDGRPKGARGKIHCTVKDALSTLLSAELEALPERLKELDTKDRIEVMIRLLPYVAPKMKSIDLSGGIEILDPDLMTLPDGTKIEI